MSIRFNHAAGTITSTNTATIVIEGGTPTIPRPLRLNASSVVFPNKVLPIGEAGAVVFDTTSKTLKYHNGTSWVELLSQSDILAPVNVSLTDIYNQLGNRVSTVTYSSSATPTASISGTNLNIVFPSSTSGTPTDVPGLFTSMPQGSISQYSLTSGQSVASIREQLGGSTGSQTGRAGTQASPYVTKTGWTFADGAWWSWAGEGGTVVQQVPNLNQNAYLKSITTTGVTKTDTVIAGSGTISDTTLTDPQHYHGFGQMLGLSGGNGDDGIFISGRTFDDGNAYQGLRMNGENDTREVRAVSGSDSRLAFTTTNAVYTNGNTTTHSHSLSAVDVQHFNVAFLYNIATPSTALNQTAGDSRYVLKTGDVMTGSLTIANSAIIRANDTNLVLWFQNSTGGERAAIYHSSSTNTIRFRSNGGTEMALSNTGALTVQSLVVSANAAIVGGQNIVRTVNGVGADVNGAVTITAGVDLIRLGARQFFVQSGSTSEFSEGYVLTGGGDFGADDGSYYGRQIQYRIAGVWYTAAYSS